MAVEFAQQLKRVVEAVLHGSRVDIAFATGMINEVVTDMLDVFGTDPQLRPTDYQSASGAMEILRLATALYDACHVIEQQLLLDRACERFLERELPLFRSHHALTTLLEHEVGDAVSEGPLVYAVWTRSPARYVYVGRTAGGKDGAMRRFDLRGKLFMALQRGSMITVMTPSSRDGAGVVELEAALVSVLGHRNALPELNVRPRHVPRAAGSAFLAEIGQLLADLASKFTASTGWPEAVR